MHPTQRTSSKSGGSRTARAARAVRIIGGQWKRTPLSVVPVEGLRPTPDRVRESVFNWLLHFCGGSLDRVAALDLFAGTGALGFETASRGARRVVLVENDARALTALLAAKNKLNANQIEILRADALATALRFEAIGENFDIVFLDPPFQSGWIERIAGPAVRILRPGGLLYVESDSRLKTEQLEPLGVELVRADKAGKVFYHLLRRKIGDIPRESTPC
jgi:16S rRNA (guanine966-N2)-methyltransferase